MNIRNRISRILSSIPNEIVQWFAYGPLDSTGHQSGTIDSIRCKPEKRFQFWEDTLVDERVSWDVFLSAFPCMNFPIEKGISTKEVYRNALRRGEYQIKNDANELSADNLEVLIRQTIAGPVIILKCQNRIAFEATLRAFGKKNEPTPIPPTQGAAYLNGMVNWGAIRWHRKIVESENRSWDIAWHEILKEGAKGFREAVIITSGSPYSGLSADFVGREMLQWKADSMNIREIHETVHHILRVSRGFVSNSLTEEIVADTLAFGEVLGPESIKFVGSALGVNRKMSKRYEIYIPDSFKIFHNEIEEIVELACLDAAGKIPHPWSFHGALEVLESWNPMSSGGT